MARKSNNYKFTRHQLDTYDPKEAIAQIQFKDPKCAKRYIDRMFRIVDFYKQNPPQHGPIEIHHIIPVVWGGPDCENNLVRLPIKAHIVVHHLLAKTLNKPMVRAFCSLVEFAKAGEFAYNVTVNQIADACLMRKQMLTRPVYLVEQELLFDSLHDAAKWTMTSILNESCEDIVKYEHRVQYVLRCISSAAKRHRTAYGVHWMFQKEVTKPLLEHLQDFKQERTVKRSNADRCRVKAIINLNTGERFNAVVDAANHYNVKRSSLADSARRGYKFAGGFWIFEEQLIAKGVTIEEELHYRELQSNKRSVDAHRKTKQTLVDIGKYKSVINLTSKTEYESMAAACLAEGFMSLPSRMKEYKDKGFVYANKCYWVLKQDLHTDIETELATQKQLHADRLCKVREQQCGRKVIHVNSQTVYNGLSDAAKKNNRRVSQVMSMLVRFKKDVDNIWMYYDQFTKFFNSDQQKCYDYYSDLKTKRKYLCNETGKIFKSLVDIANELNVNRSNVQNAMNDHVAICGYTFTAI